MNDQTLPRQHEFFSASLNALNNPIVSAIWESFSNESELIILSFDENFTWNWPSWQLHQIPTQKINQPSLIWERLGITFETSLPWFGTAVGGILFLRYGVVPIISTVGLSSMRRRYFWIIYYFHIITTETRIRVVAGNLFFWWPLVQNKSLHFQS